MTLALAMNFDVGSGTTVTDVSGNGHTGTFVDPGGAGHGLKWWISGANGSPSMCYCDSTTTVSGTYISIPRDAALESTDHFTIMAMTEVVSLAGKTFRVLLTKPRAGDNDSIAIYPAGGTAGIPIATITTTDGVFTTPSTPDPLTATTFYHMAVRYDGANLDLLINGSVAATVPATGTIVYDNTEPWCLLGSSAFGAEWLPGDIDDLRIYPDEALTDAQILALSTTAVTAGAPPVPKGFFFLGGMNLAATGTATAQGAASFAFGGLTVAAAGSSTQSGGKFFDFTAGAWVPVPVWDFIDGVWVRSDGATGSGYPDASTTGVTPGTTLQMVPDDVTSGDGWVWNAGGWVSVNVDGAVINGLQVNGSFDVTAPNVTIQNCKVAYSGGGGDTFGVSIRHGVNVTVQHCEISGAMPDGGTDVNRLTAGIKDIYFDSTGTQILANNIYDASCGAQMDSGLIQGNYIHNLANNGTDHTNCLLSSNGADEELTIRHNTLLNQLDQNSAIALYSDAGTSQQNKLVDDNLLGGGGYCIYAGGGDHGGDPNPPNMVYTNNKFTTRFFDLGGEFGPVAYPVSIATWSGNVWADGPNAGQTVTNG